MPSALPEGAALRLASYNVEWFNGLFDDAGHPLADNAPSARYKITRAQQWAAIGAVFQALNADAVMIIEAPDTGSKRSTVKALETFARTFHLRASKAIIGFASETEQEIALLYDPARVTVVHDPQSSDAAPGFDRSFHHDLDLDARPETIRFSKPPLELLVEAQGQTFRMIGVHAKSKAPHGARNPAEVVRLGIESRRKQLAQCLWIRARVEAHLIAGEDLIVLGDFNDGPGLDEYEKLFGHSGVELVMAPDADPAHQMFDPHAQIALSHRVGLMPTSARFWHAGQKRYFGALLDFIMLSPRLAAMAPIWRIWHPMDDPECWKDSALCDALLTASDHFPVTVDIAFGGTRNFIPDTPS